MAWSTFAQIVILVMLALFVYMIIVEINKKKDKNDE